MSGTSKCPMSELKIALRRAPSGFARRLNAHALATSRQAQSGAMIPDFRARAATGSPTAHVTGFLTQTVRSDWLRGGDLNSGGDRTFKRSGASRRILRPHDEQSKWVAEPRSARDKGGSHMLLLEHPEEVARAIRDFIRAHLGPGPPAAMTGHHLLSQRRRAQAVSSPSSSFAPDLPRHEE